MVCLAKTKNKRADVCVWRGGGVSFIKLSSVCTEEEKVSTDEEMELLCRRLSKQSHLIGSAFCFLDYWVNIPVTTNRLQETYPIQYLYQCVFVSSETRVFKKQSQQHFLKVFFAKFSHVPQRERMQECRKA